MYDDLFGNNGPLAGGEGADLAKTLMVGHANGIAAPGSLTGASALLMESVDATLKSVTLSERNLVFWPLVPQDRAYSTVEQYIRTNSYGDEGEATIPESGSPAMNDSNYDRHAQKTVFYSTRRGVSMVNQFVRGVGGMNSEAAEQQAGTVWMLTKLERDLYKSNADFSNAGLFDGALAAIPQKRQNLSLNGAELQIRRGDSDYSVQIRAFDGFGGNSSVVQDANDVLDETKIESLAVTLGENLAFPSMLHLETRVLSDFIKQFYPKERVTALGTQDGRAGYIVRTLATSAGDVALTPNVMLRAKRGAKSQSDRPGLTPNAPATLTNNAAASVVTGSGNAIDQTAATATSALIAGEIYIYTVTACNEQGEGSGSLTSVSATISTTGNNVTFKIGDPSSGPTATHYAVYRTPKTGTGTAEFIGYVARSGTTTLFTDLGKKKQGASTAFMFDMRPETMIWKQLAPLIKRKQATLGTADEFLLWLAGCFMMPAPRWCGLIPNIVRAA